MTIRCDFCRDGECCGQIGATQAKLDKAIAALWHVAKFAGHETRCKPDQCVGGCDQARYAEKILADISAKGEVKLHLMLGDWPRKVECGLLRNNVQYTVLEWLFEANANACKRCLAKRPKTARKKGNRK